MRSIFGEGSVSSHPKANRLRRKPLKRGLAKILRTQATDAEQRLWLFLKSKQFGGLKFRRQQPIGPYIADFYCPAAKLIVELDGEQHGEERNAIHDEARTLWLEARGYSVLRFWNVEFLKHPDAVLFAIEVAIKSAAKPLPEIRIANFDPPSREG